MIKLYHSLLFAIVVPSAIFSFCQVFLTPQTPNGIYTAGENTVWSASHSNTINVNYSVGKNGSGNLDQVHIASWGN
jgi:hypothetical protein